MATDDNEWQRMATGRAWRPHNVNRLESCLGSVELRKHFRPREQILLGHGLLCGGDGLSVGREEETHVKI